jgi:hypothetical protein
MVNIGPKERRKRLKFGLAMFGVSLIFAVVLIVSGIPRGWRIAIFLPFWAAALGVLQATAGT